MALALTEPMNHPKRTQEIATILCELLGGDIELPRMIVSLLKEAETEWSRDWHIHRYRDLYGVENGVVFRPHTDYQDHNIKWREDFTDGDIATRVSLQHSSLFEPSWDKRKSQHQFIQIFNSPLPNIFPLISKWKAEPEPRPMWLHRWHQRPEQVPTEGNHLRYIIKLMNHVARRQRRDGNVL